MKTCYRTVGFTNSVYAGSGSREIGWTGKFFDTFEEAEEAGCGVGEGWHNGEETQEYVLDDDGTVTVDGDEASDRTAQEVRDYLAG